MFPVQGWPECSELLAESSEHLLVSVEQSCSMEGNNNNKKNEEAKCSLQVKGNSMG